MEKLKLQELVDQGLSIYKIATNLEKGYSTIRYWLKKYDLKTSHSTPKIFEDTDGNKLCTSCKQWFPQNKFYSSNCRNKKWCKSCVSISVKNRQRKLKLKAVQYKGGACELCGYNKCLGALQFHHIDPEDKDPNWKYMKLRSFSEQVKQELNKCILLCANCHSEQHTQYCS